jgi:hypothetical protein
MDKPGSLCTHPARAALHRALWARVFPRPSVSSPPGKNPLIPRRLFRHGRVPHLQCSIADLLRIVNELPPTPCRLYAGSLRPGCGAPVSFRACRETIQTIKTEKISPEWVLLACKESQKMRGGYKIRPQTMVAAGFSLCHVIVALDAADPALNGARQLAPGWSPSWRSNLRPSLSPSTKMVSPSLNSPARSMGASLSCR